MAEKIDWTGIQLADSPQDGLQATGERTVLYTVSQIRAVCFLGGALASSFLAYSNGQASRDSRWTNTAGMFASLHVMASASGIAFYLYIYCSRVAPLNIAFLGPALAYAVSVGIVWSSTGRFSAGIQEHLNQGGLSQESHWAFGWGLLALVLTAVVGLSFAAFAVMYARGNA